MSRSGFTLLEVVLAVLVLSIGILALAGSLTTITRLGALGRGRGRVAVALASRADWVRVEARRNGCLPPAPGSNRLPDGVRESWRPRTINGMIEVVLIAQSPDRSARPDTVLLRFPCN